MVNNHGDRKSPKDRVGLDPFQMAFINGSKWLKKMGLILTTYESSDDPPSGALNPFPIKRHAETRHT